MATAGLHAITKILKSCASLQNRKFDKIIWPTGSSTGIEGILHFDNGQGVDIPPSMASLKAACRILVPSFKLDWYSSGCLSSCHSSAPLPF